MNDYKLLLEFFGQVDDDIPSPLFELGDYDIEKKSNMGKEVWFIRDENGIVISHYSSQGEALNYVVEKWANDQSWAMLHPGEFLHNGSYIISYNDDNDAWELYNGSKHINSWIDPISAFGKANEIIEYKKKRDSIYKRIKKVKQLYLSDNPDTSAKAALRVIADIETEFNTRPGGLEKIEIITLNGLYTRFGGDND